MMAPVKNQTDFTRVIWSNKSERWRKIIGRVSNDWLEFEQLLVREGHRVAFITQVFPNDLVDFSKKWHSYGCITIPLGMIGVSNTYTSNAPPIIGNKFQYRVLVGRGINLDYSDTSIGRLLGYPDCCIEFFDRVWNQEKHIDTTWPMMENSRELAQKCNILLRYIGIRPVFHLPCAFDCIPTVSLAHKNIELFQQYYPDSCEVLLEILQWPVEWSAVNGIAQILFPLGKISAMTDLYKDKKVVRYEGTAYPIDGESGTVFPYTRKQELMSKVNMKVVKKVNAAHAINGFTDPHEQLRSHEWLINEFNKYFHDLELDEHSFIDLGAGNGDLVKLVMRLYSGMQGVGIDANYGNSYVLKGNINEFQPMDKKYDIAIIAEQRFTDSYKNEEEALDHISTFANNLFVYNYATRKAWMIKLKEKNHA